MKEWIASMAEGVVPPDDTTLMRARAHLATLTKPPGSLGRLEHIAERLAGIQDRVPPQLDRARVIVFAADHGITQNHAVSPYPRAVTAQMVTNFLAGGAAINAFAKVAGVELEVVDVGVATPIPQVDATRISFVRRNVSLGSSDFTVARALDDAQLRSAVEVGVECARAAARAGVSCIALGEMGIGNTTAASAVVAALTGRAAAEVTGRGTGADDAMLATKCAVIEQALALHRPFDDPAPLVLAKVGGLELAAICGCAIEAAKQRITVVVDGFISTAAVALARRWCPAIDAYVFCGHRSAEPGHDIVLQAMGWSPLLDLQMRLGEGTGATLAVGVLRAAASMMSDMATFASAGVDARA